MLWHKCQPETVFFLITSGQKYPGFNQNDFVDQSMKETFLAQRFSR